MNSLTKLVQPVHFDEFGGEHFERLVFAYHLRTERWRSLDWYGQTGSDLGRDIWGLRIRDAAKDESVCIQCANRKTVPATKAVRDINKLLTSPSGKPDVFRLVCSSRVSAKLRDKIKAHASNSGIAQCEIWSGVEFEERLRSSCESLLARFVNGVSFPDSPDELRRFTEELNPASDHETIGLLARAFDRPAFHTPFQGESNLPAFKQAITDTIQVLNTGIWQTREGKEIGRLPSRHMVTDSKLRETLANIERQLTDLRNRFDQLVKTGDIKHCGCSNADCPVFMLSSRAIQEMDELRSKILSGFARIQPGFSVKVGW